MAVETQRAVGSSGKRGDEIRLFGVDLEALDGQRRLLERGFEPLDDIDGSNGWVLGVVSDNGLGELEQFRTTPREVLGNGRGQIGRVHRCYREC
jgi:hypothetical protein